MKKRNNLKKEEQFTLLCSFLFVFPYQQHKNTALLQLGKQKLWIGVVQDPEHGWQWSNGKPFRYLKWSTGKS